MITAVVSGYIGKDAEQRKAGEADVVSFSIASKGYRGGKDVTDWVSISYFGQRATKVKQYLTKGAFVTVRGELCCREYESKGEKRFSLDLRADAVELGPKKGGGGDDTSFDPSDPNF